MKNSINAVLTTATLSLCTFLSPSRAHDLNSARPDSHAPIGVTGDHLHKKGEWMVDYRFMYMEMADLSQGSDKISNQQAFDQGYSMVPTEMTMEMNMFMLMYAPSDSVTLMAMTMYNHSSMSMTMNPHMEMDGHGMSMDHSMHGSSHDMNHSHSTTGWGDTVLSALVRLYEKEGQVLILNLGVGLPTADVEEKEGDEYMPYGMQLGNGVWDIRPGLTFTSQHEQFSWGAQAKARVALEDENDAGFRYGNQYGATTWAAVPAGNAFSFSGRLAYEKQESISGHYNGPHGHASPPSLQPNYGGEYAEAGLGINFRVPDGKWVGNRLALELTTPIYENVNGIQLATDYTLYAGWQFSW